MFSTQNSISFKLESMRSYDLHLAIFTSIFSKSICLFFCSSTNVWVFQMMFACSLGCLRGISLLSSSFLPPKLCMWICKCKAHGHMTWFSVTYSITDCFHTPHPVKCMQRNRKDSERNSFKNDRRIVRIFLNDRRVDFCPLVGPTIPCRLFW